VNTEKSRGNQQSADELFVKYQAFTGLGAPIGSSQKPVAAIFEITRGNRHRSDLLKHFAIPLLF